MSFKSLEGGTKLLKEVDLENEKPTPPEPPQQSLLHYTTKTWKKIGTVIIILFTILTALSINNLIQTILVGVSPTKEYSSIVQLILAQTVYVIVVTIGFVSAFLLVANQEYKNKKESIEIQTTKN